MNHLSIVCDPLNLTALKIDPIFLAYLIFRQALTCFVWATCYACSIRFVSNAGQAIGMTAIKFKNALNILHKKGNLPALIWDTML